MIKKHFFIFILLLFFFKSSAYSLDESNDFSLSYDLSYDTDRDGNTHITQKGHLTNLTDQKYISYLDLEFTSPDIKNISAYDDFGSLSPAIVREGTKTLVHISFNKPPLGIGKKISFSLSYDNALIAQKKATGWEIVIPKEDIAPQVIAYNITIQIPKSFGEINYISPKPQKGLFWTKSELNNQGIKIKTIIPKTVSPTETMLFNPSSSQVLPMLIFTILFAITVTLTIRFILSRKFQHG
ncbi:hypothetical protein A2773_05800 [Candidatus Gottesmanbacteria bacterium RIFCSPHIGHO2_01_FULL_39_10]|uniref:Cohesin domain-containing protein n=1 Tax=Candidatus Gottesmanbacteria bacterium RIFCSPHIGHO2_01_FULL_39_10 TaxID=1798375 RepID=A0A1F5ZKX5_9BACT|nr:MAG: hypothetical protein A2773_05800 [Candidatus Gottesmanbacteria bacterium RIFCSPHIGHO2_01_FULL_39_10]